MEVLPSRDRPAGRPGDLSYGITHISVAIDLGSADLVECKKRHLCAVRRNPIHLQRIVLGPVTEPDRAVGLVMQPIEILDEEGIRLRGVEPREVGGVEGVPLST